jgi:predicted RNase H-like nuclease (RuvC/YqgF family)
MFAEDDPGDQPSNEDEQKETEEKEQSGLDPEALRKELEAVRKEAAKYRTERKALAEEIETLKKNLGKALGFEDDKGKADVNAALEKIQQLQEEIQNERLQNSFHKAATNVGADVELTWAFLKGTGKLTPGMSQEDIENVLKETLEAYPKLKVEETPKKSGGAFTQPKDKGGKVDMNVAIRKMARR